MKALVWNGKPYPEGFELKEVERPKADSDHAIIKNKAAGICGSDLHIVAGRVSLPEEWLPIVLGHEIAGMVVETGKDVTEFDEGDRVAVEPLHGCFARGIRPLCRFCGVGQYHLCPNLVHVGTYYPGGYGEYSPVHSSKLYKLPDSISLEEASILDCLAVGVHAVRVGKPSLEDTVVVVGCGTIGLDVVQCLKALGVNQIIGVAKYSWQADVAKKVGVDDTVCLEEAVDVTDSVMELTDGSGVDQAYDCVGGNTNVAQRCIELCRPGGRVVIVGVYDGSRPINLAQVVLREVQIIPSMSYSFYGTKPEFEVAFQLLKSGRASHKLLITHRFGINEWRQAWEAVSNKKKSKVIKAIWEYE